MIPRRFWKHFARWFRAPAARADTYLHDAEQFHSILDRERARSDRNGDVFSLLVFSVVKPGERGAWFKSLVRILRKRLRATDEVGWIDDVRIAVILPVADEAGAWHVADDVLSVYPADCPMLQYEVYSYPPQRKPMGRAEAALEGASNRSAESVGNDDTRHPIANGDRRTGARNMESLFAHPTPLWKRTIDIVGAATGLLIAAPVMLAAAISVKASSHGPVIFRQRRGGLGGAEFTMYKFRTMEVNAESRKAELLPRNEQDGPAFKIANDPRVTLVGRWLRRTSIDELPQLWNVLRGDMSLVGPRPLPCDESDKCNQWHRRRHDVAPGLTCIWQVRGRSGVSFTEWMRMDLAYVRSRSLGQDLRLLALTVPTVLLGRGAQ